MDLGLPGEGLAQCFSYSVTLMFVSMSKQKGRPVAGAALVPSGLYEKGCGCTPAYLEVFGEIPLDVRPLQIANLGAGKTCVCRQVFSFMLLGNRLQLYKSGFSWLCFVSF